MPKSIYSLLTTEQIRREEQKYQKIMNNAELVLHDLRRTIYSPPAAKS